MAREVGAIRCRRFGEIAVAGEIGGVRQRIVALLSAIHGRMSIGDWRPRWARALTLDWFRFGGPARAASGATLFGGF
jgi:hypothetical protein